MKKILIAVVAAVVGMTSIPTQAASLPSTPTVGKTNLVTGTHHRRHRRHRRRRIRRTTAAAVVTSNSAITL